MIGRDLVRLLQYIARIPEVENLWKDMLSNPTSISPHFTGLSFFSQLTLKEHIAKPAHVVTSTKQSPVLKGHLFLFCQRNIHMN